MKRKSIIMMLICMCMAVSSNVSAQTLKLSPVFGEDMVVQRHQLIPVWGWADAGATVTVTMNGAKAKTKADSNGKWRVKLKKMKAGGPYALTVAENLSSKIQKKSESITLKNVWVGDVFLFSGQSNQELPIRRCMDNKAIADLSRSYTNTNVHIMKLPQQFNFSTEQDTFIPAPWVTINPETAPNIAALSYFVGKELQEYAQVPVGIINSSVGGTRVECWMSRQNLMQFPQYQEELQKRKYNQVDWVDSVRRTEQRAGGQWERRLATKDTIINRWKDADYDFSSWTPVNLFTNWSNGKTGGYWFRHTLNLTAEQVAKLQAENEALLRLGAMKDADSVFVNKKYVGNTTYQYPPRNYKVAASLLHEGENEIMIHLMAQNGRPHFVAGKDYQLEIGKEIVSLKEGWTMGVGIQCEPKPTQTYFVDTPQALYNAMIKPLEGIAFSGMVWYQGEANEARPDHYTEYMAAMVDEWQKMFPGKWASVIVQLAGFRERHHEASRSGWCKIREAQRQASIVIPNAALATAIDCGESNDIHPQDKQTIGHRVALQMRRLAYKEKGLVSEGPRAIKAERRDGKVVLTFSPETGKLRYFNDPEAEVTGDYELTIKRIGASSTYTLDGNKLRYCWDDYPYCSIYNEQGIATPQFEIEIQ